ncbi:MAG: VWA domain-containing protein [Puniceicoccales bacterium]
MNFEHPSWLIAVPVGLILLGALFAASSRSRKNLVRKFASDRLVKQLLASYSPARRQFKNILLLIALMLVLFALARPQWGFNWRETKSKGIDIMFAVDVSKSMLAQDIKPNRLDRSKFAILDFLEKLEGDRVGLVAFAGNAFLQCPLTLDYDAFRQSLEAVNTDVIALGGTDIARAITESEAAFSDDNNYKIIVLITDGEDLEDDGIVRAKEAAENGVTLYTVGVGTTEGALIPVRNRFGQLEYLRDDEGELVRTKLDADTLTQIAETTNGFYTPLGATGYGLEQVYEAGLEAVPEHELSAQMQREWLERFQWPLGIAIVLLAWEPLIGTRRNTLRRKAKAPVVSPPKVSKIVALLILGTVALMSANDLSASVRAGEKLFQNGDYHVAAELFRAELEADPLNAKAAYNLGNAMQALEQPAAAQAAYMQALATTDFDLQADVFYNLGSVRFLDGQAKLADADPTSVVEQGQQANQQSALALTQGNSVLALAQRQAPPQQQVQQAIQLAEQAKTGAEEAKKANAAVQAVAKPVEKLWKSAKDDFASSLELKPAGADAAHNFNYVSEKLTALERDLRQLESAQQQHEVDIPALEELIEKLRELLDEQSQDQNQQNQDQQNQDQQNQDQQNQDQQNQDQQGQQDQQNQEQSGEQNQQQSGEQGEQNQDPSKSGEEQQAGEEGEQSGDEESGEQGDEQSGQESGEQQSGEDGERQERSSEEVDEMIDAMNQGQQQEEGAEQPQSQSGEESGESGEDEEPSMRVSEEDAQAAAEQAAAMAQAGKEGEGEPTEGAVIGVMSREDARRLLESLKGSEKKLPVSGYGRRESNRDEEGKRKDW